MAITRKQENQIKKAAISVIFLFTLLSVASMFLGTPGLKFGIWGQSEPILIGLHVCSAFLCLALTVLVAVDRHDYYLKRILHPFVLIPFALALWGFFVSLFHKAPVLTWFGSPETGDGAFWYLELSIIIASAIVIGGFRRAGTWLVVGVFALTTLVTVATVYYLKGGPNALVPFFFSDYLGLSGICLAGIALSFRFPKYSKSLTLAGLAIGLAIVFFSGNRATVIIAFGLAPAFWVFLWLIERRWDVRIVRRVAMVSIALFIIVISSVIAVVDFHPYYIKYLGTPLEGPINSLSSRHRLLGIIASAIADTPKTLFVGNGWGTFSDSFARYLPTDWATLRDDTGRVTTKEMFHGNWDAIFRVDFHSHNSFADTLHGVGIFGAILLISLFAIIPVLTRSGNIKNASAFVLAISGAATLWFLLPSTLPLLALGIGFYSSSSRQIFEGKHLKSITLFSGGVMLIALIAASIQSYNFSNQAYFFTPPMKENLSYESGPPKCLEYFEDSGRGPGHLQHRLRTFTNFVVRRSAKGEELTKEHASFLKGLICASEHYIDTYDNIRVLIGGLNSRADLAFITLPDRFKPIVKSYNRNWEERVRWLLRRAPNREDLAAPYLLHLQNTQQTDKFNSFSTYLYSQSPKSPVSLWFSGMALLNRDDNQARLGMSRMQKALNNGIERLIPVDINLKAQLLGANDEVQSGPGSGLPRTSIPMLTRYGQIILNVEIAATEKAREAGLMHRTSFGPIDGLLLVYPEPQIISLWMKDTYLSLDLMFVDEAGYIVEIVENTIPRLVSPITSKNTVKSVLETRSGFVKDKNINIGDRFGSILP